MKPKNKQLQNLTQPAAGKKTALIWAARNNNTELGLALISAGANLDLQDGDKQTALILAATKNNIELDLALINKGANRNLHYKDGKTALDHVETQEMRDVLNSP